MANDIKYQINVQIADNTVTKDDPNDKIFVIVSLGTADKERIIAEMMDMNPGVEPEMMRLVLDLEKRAVKRLLLNGMRVNNGLFEAVPQCRGLVRGTAWDPEANEIYVNFTQGKELREAIADVVVNVIPASMPPLASACSTPPRGRTSPSRARTSRWWATTRRSASP